MGSFQTSIKLFLQTPFTDSCRAGSIVCKTVFIVSCKKVFSDSYKGIHVIESLHRVVQGSYQTPAKESLKPSLKISLQISENMSLTDSCKEYLQTSVKEWKEKAGLP